MLKIYGSENCPACKEKTKELDEKGINYTYLDVSNFSKEEIKEITEKTGQMSLPIVVEDDEEE